jgi:hypothetical protein
MTGGSSTVMVLEVLHYLKDGAPRLGTGALPDSRFVSISSVCGRGKTWTRLVDGYYFGSEARRRRR